MHFTTVHPFSELESRRSHEIIYADKVRSALESQRVDDKDDKEEVDPDVCNDWILDECDRPSLPKQDVISEGGDSTAGGKRKRDEEEREEAGGMKQRRTE